MYSKFKNPRRWKNYYVVLAQVCFPKNVKIKIYIAIMLPIVMLLREERRLMVFENRRLRRIFRSKRGEVTGDWRRLHD